MTHCAIDKNWAKRSMTSLFHLELLYVRLSGTAHISDKLAAAVWRCRRRGVEVHHGQGGLMEGCKQWLLQTAATHCLLFVCII